MSKKKATKKFSDLRQTDVPLLSELINETFDIHGFEEVETPLGMKANVETSRGTYATFSGVLIKQLNFMKDKKAFPVEVTMRQVKRYHTFE